VNTLGFRTLVLGVIASALVLATAMLGWLAYTTVYERILLGFDSKLLGISGTVGALTDGAAHADFQRPHVLSRFAPGPAGSAWGWDTVRGTLVRVDLDRAAVVEHHPWPEEPRALLWLEAGERLLIQRADGALVDRSAPEAVLATAPAGESWVSDGERLYRWDGLQLFPEPIGLTVPPSAEESALEPGPTLEPSSTTVDASPTGEPVRLPEALSLLARDRLQGHWVGWSADTARLIAFDDTGRVLKSAVLSLGERTLAGLLAAGDQVWLASDELLRHDWTAESLNEDSEPGYYDPEHPFVAQHAPMYRSLRERVGLTFLYTEVYIGGDQIRYILDGSVGDSHSPPGYLDSVPDADIDALVRAQVEGTPFVSGIRQWEAWGLVKVSAAPILNPQGGIVALAGADVDIGVIRSKTRNALFAVLAVGALLLSISGLVSLWVAQSVTRPLRDIKNAALRIAAGQYGARLESAAAADDIGLLAGSLDRLSLRLREQAAASSASQSALLSGRLDEALRASLQRELPQPTRLRLPKIDGCVVLVRTPGPDETEADQALRAGMLRALVLQMLATGTVATESLLRNDPALQVVLDWTPSDSRLRWAARQPGLHIRGSDGSRWRLAPDEVQLAPDTAVCLANGEVLVERGSAS